MTALLLALENDPGEAVGLSVPRAVKGPETRDKVVLVAVVLDMADLTMNMCAGPLILRRWGSAEGVVEVICGRPLFCECVGQRGALVGFVYYVLVARSGLTYPNV